MLHVRYTLTPVFIKGWRNVCKVYYTSTFNHYVNIIYLPRLFYWDFYLNGRLPESIHYLYRDSCTLFCSYCKIISNFLPPMYIKLCQVFSLWIQRTYFERPLPWEGMRDRQSWKTGYSWHRVLHFNIIEPVTKDYLGWWITFLWPMEWSSKKRFSCTH